MKSNWSRILLATAIIALLNSGSILVAGKGGNGKGKPGGGGEDPPPTTPLFTYVDLGSLGGQDVYTFAINNHDDVVGKSTTADGVWHAFVSTTDSNGARVMIDLNDFLGPGDPLVLVSAFEINDAGQIVGQGSVDGLLVGYRLTPPSGSTVAIDAGGAPVFLVDGAEVTPEISILVPPFGFEAEARDVNLAGDVVGPYRDSTGNVGVFVYSDANGFTDLGAPAGATGGSTPHSINIVNEIAGTSSMGSGELHAWKYTVESGFVDLGGLDADVEAPTTSSNAMNSMGEIVGLSTVVLSSKRKRQTVGTHGFVYSAATMVDIGEIAPNGINDWGDIVGTLSGNITVLFSDPTFDPLSVNSVVELPGPLSTLSSPLHDPDINDAGVITGYSGESFDGVPEKAFLLVPIAQ